MHPRELNLTNIPVISKLGRPYRLSATMKNLDVPSKWIKNVEHWHWYYFFIYTDDNSFFGFEFDYNDKFVQKFNHEETRKILDNL
jgi:hypothetical protein